MGITWFKIIEKQLLEKEKLHLSLVFHMVLSTGLRLSKQSSGIKKTLFTVFTPTPKLHQIGGQTEDGNFVSPSAQRICTCQPHVTCLQARGNSQNSIQKQKLTL
jgi:hypothetical protein